MKGAGYGFTGSILSNDGGANAGNASYASDTGKDCGNVKGGKRVRTRKTKHKSRARGKARRKTRRGGGALMVPRTGYSFNGTGISGTANTIPY